MDVTSLTRCSHYLFIPNTTAPSSFVFCVIPSSHNHSPVSRLDYQRPASLYQHSWFIIHVNCSLKMKISSAVLLSSVLVGVDAFQVGTPTRPFLQSKSVWEGRGIIPTPSCLFAADEDCGCGGPEILSGDVPEGARTLNPRAAMRKAQIYRTSGEAVSMDELLGTNNKLSIVVFLRSLG